MPDFTANYKNLVDFTIGPGTLIVVGDIVKAAQKILLKPVSTDFDPIKVREKVLNDIRQKVIKDFEIKGILVSNDGKGSCEVICPKCQVPKRLAPISNIWPTQFNIYNFERHYTVTHSSYSSYSGEGRNQKLNELKTVLKRCNERYESECSKVKNLKRALSDLNRINQSLNLKRMKFELPDKENCPPSLNVEFTNRFNILTSKYDSIEKENIRLKSELNQEINRSKNNLNSVSEKNQLLMASLKKNESQLIAMQTENDRLTNLLKEGAPQAQVESLQQYNTQLMIKIQDLTSILETKESQLCGLEKDNEQLNSDLVVKNGLHDDRDNVLTENERLKLLLESNVGTISQLKTQLNRSYQIRNGLLNTVMDLKGNYRVFVRIRPIQNHDSSSKTFEWNCFNESILHIVDAEKGSREYKFDRVFGPDSDQNMVFDAVSPMIQTAIDGFNVCIFAYGSTGSGKTFTINGSKSNPGMLPRSIEFLFESIEDRRQCGIDYEVEVSFIQIYNEALTDMLRPMNNETMEIRSIAENQIDINVTNLSMVKIENKEQFLESFQTAICNRKTASTKCNAYSFRSHFIAQIWLKGKSGDNAKLTKSVINIVDLAGMECVNDSGNRMESGSINKSLLELYNVVNGLKNGDKVISYRNSKLTHLLKPSLSGSSKTLMIVNVSPMQDHVKNSKKALDFGSIAMKTKLPKIKTNTA